MTFGMTGAGTLTRAVGAVGVLCELLHAPHKNVSIKTGTWQMVSTFT